MADIQNFSKAEELIKKNPRQAETQAFEWKRFLKDNAESSPEVLLIKTEEEFYKWTTEHPEKHVDPYVWAGKNIVDYYASLQQEEDEPTQKKEEKEPLREVEEKPREEISQSVPSRILRQILREESPAIPKSPAQIGEAASPIRSVEQGASRGLGSASRAAGRAGATAGRTAGLAAQAATRGIIAFLATPPGWITIGVIVVILIIVFIIVHTKGRDKYSPQMNNQGAIENTNASASAIITPSTATPSATFSPEEPSATPPAEL